jgi:hypothetical protein
VEQVEVLAAVPAGALAAVLVEAVVAEPVEALVAEPAEVLVAELVQADWRVHSADRIRATRSHQRRNPLLASARRVRTMRQELLL